MTTIRPNQIDSEQPAGAGAAGRGSDVGQEAIQTAERASELSRRLTDLFGAPPKSARPRDDEAGITTLQAQDGLAPGSCDPYLECLHMAAERFDTRRVWLICADSKTAEERVFQMRDSDEDEALPAQGRDLQRRLRAAHEEGKDLIALTQPAGDVQCTAIPVAMERLYVGTLIVLANACKPMETRRRVVALGPAIERVGLVEENRHLNGLVWHMTTSVCCAFSMAIESRNAYTGGHVLRVTAYTLALADHLALFDEQRSAIRLGGLLHDIGKVAIPDEVLDKPGRLTDDEYDIIKRHPVVGDQIIRGIPELRVVQPIVRHHHERWDGRGYPDGLKGKSIPYLARMIAIADSYDAMTSNRPYRSGLSHEQALREIVESSGTQFDPELAFSFSHLPLSTLEESVSNIFRWWDRHGGQTSIQAA